MSPQPMSIDERYSQAKKSLNTLFANQSKLQGKLDFNQALARGLKYNLDYRIKIVNNALQAGQLDMAEYAMLPALNTSGSLYTRNNDLLSSGISSNGTETSLSSSTPRTLRTGRVAVTWNILDFGLAYVRAKQQSNRILIAQEESRKQLQQLTQDIIVAYWSAYSAQELMKQTREFQHILINAKSKLETALHDKTIPKETLLNYQSILLEGNRKLIQLQFKYDKAMYDLKHLLNLPLDMRLEISAPPVSLTKVQKMKTLDFKKIDAITLVNRPELQGQRYQQRIAKLGVKAVILQSLPGISLNTGWNYNSNQYLGNKVWIDKSVDIAWNLLNLASLPTSYNTAKMQVKYEKLKLMALTMTVLTETRYAYSHYMHLSDEYVVSHQQTLNAEALYQLNNSRKKASLASDQQVILAKLHAITAKMDEDLLLSDLSTALGQLYLSMGTEILPNVDVDHKSLAATIKLINQQYVLKHTVDINEYVDKKYSDLFKAKTKLAAR